MALTAVLFVVSDALCVIPAVLGPPGWGLGTIMAPVPQARWGRSEEGPDTGAGSQLQPALQPGACPLPENPPQGAPGTTAAPPLLPRSPRLSELLCHPGLPLVLGLPAVASPGSSNARKHAWGPCALPMSRGGGTDFACGRNIKSLRVFANSLAGERPQDADHSAAV